MKTPQHTKRLFNAVIFDVGGVLVDNPWPGMLNHYTTHLNVDKEHFQSAYDEVVEEWQMGEIHEKAFWEKMCSKLKVALPTSEDLWREGFKKTYKEKDEVFALIEKLKSKGYKIGLLSNTETTVMEFLIERQYKHFDVFVYSCGVGMAKPNRDIYEHTLEKMGIKAEEAIFIDDKQENIEGANAVGMKGVLFESPQQLEKILLELI
jgi:putative hydrolase of the HAD superfamily